MREHEIGQGKRPQPEWGTEGLQGRGVPGYGMTAMRPKQSFNRNVGQWKVSVTSSVEE